jgi:prophage regulatory protein
VVNPVHLPDTGFLRLPDVLRFFPVSRSTWWTDVRNGKFPAAVKLAPRVTAWRAEDIRKLIEEVGAQSHFPILH